MTVHPTCTASQLIEHLRKLMEAHGDLPVYLDDPDTSWLLNIGVAYREGDAPFARFEITAEYHDDDPVGCAFYKADSRHN